MNRATALHTKYERLKEYQSHLALKVRGIDNVCIHENC